MNGAVDFSNPYCVLQTNSEYEGHGVVSLESVLIVHMIQTLTWRQEFHHRARQ